MDAKTYELKQIMTPERRYVIPTFQRDYEWTKDGQWQLLFEDLESVADRLGMARANAAATGASMAKAEKAVSPHFLGAIVCDQLPSPAGGLDVRAVIDGQQRLTTLQLLVRGVLDVLIEQNSSRVPQVRRLLENPPDVVTQPHEKHKLWPRRKDRLVWPQAMGDAVPTDGSHLYLQCRRFFAQETRAAATATDGTNRIDNLVDALLDLFKLVVIDLEANDDAQVIFEVLNGRQTPLSASDLVKNLLFLRGELADEKELEQLYDNYWAEFDEAWWKKEIGTGHAARGRRDVLLSVWLTAASGAEANVGHLYGQVRDYLADAGRNTKDILIELHAYGQAYMAIYRAKEAESPALARAYRRLDRLNILTAVPILTWLRTLPVTQLSHDDHVQCVRAIESWVVRRMVVGANTRGYGAAFLSVLKSAQAAARVPGGNIASAIIDGLDKSPNSLVWPTDDAVNAAFTNSTFYGWVSQERIRMLLGSIDEQMQADNKKTEPAVFDYDKLQIEHVMPQAWRENWPLEPAVTADPTARTLAEGARDSAVHRIGNLTLVTPEFNQSVSNLDWKTAKKPELTKQSKLQLNHPIAGKETWNETTISARASMLAKVACRIWPHANELRVSR